MGLYYSKRKLFDVKKKKVFRLTCIFLAKEIFLTKFFKRHTCGYGFWCIYFKDCFFEKWETINFLGGEFDCIPRAWLNYSYGDYTVVKQERGSKSRTFTSKWLMKIRDWPRHFMSECFESKLRLLYRSIFR